MESSIAVIRPRRPLSLKKNILRTGLMVNMAQGFMMNIFINASMGLGVYLLNGLRPIPLFGALSLSGDLIGMSATLTFIVSWLNIKTAHAEIKHHPSKQIESQHVLVHILRHIIPTPRWIRVVVMTMIFTALCFPVIETLRLHGKLWMSGFEFILFKSLYGGVLAVGVIALSSYSVYLKKT